MSSAWDKRDAGSGHYVENLDRRSSGGKKEKRKATGKVAIKTEAARGRLRRLCQVTRKSLRS